MFPSKEIEGDTERITTENPEQRRRNSETEKNGGISQGEFEKGTFMVHVNYKIQ